MDKKKSYFLSIDAFVAVVMIVLGFVIINSQFYYEPYTTQHEIYSRDFMDSLTLQLPDYNVEHYHYLGLYKELGYFEDYTSTLLEEIVRFVVLNITNECDECFERAHNLTNETIGATLTPAFSVMVYLTDIDDEEIVLLNITRSNIENSRTITSSSKMVSVVEKDIFYPYVARVIVWS